jgi:hypothetical protein
MTRTSMAVHLACPAQAYHTKQENSCLTLQRPSVVCCDWLLLQLRSAACCACRHCAFSPTCDMPAVRGLCHDCCSNTTLCPNCVLQMEQQREPSNRPQFHRGTAAVAAGSGARGIFPKAPRQHHSSQQRQAQHSTSKAQMQHQPKHPHRPTSDCNTATHSRSTQHQHQHNSRSTCQQEHREAQQRGGRHRSSSHSSSVSGFRGERAAGA